MSENQSAASGGLSAAAARLLDDVIFLGSLLGAAESSGGVASVKSESLRALIASTRMTLDDIYAAMRERDEAAVAIAMQLAENRRAADAKLREQQEKATAALAEAKLAPFVAPQTAGVD